MMLRFLNLMVALVVISALCPGAAAQPAAPGTGALTAGRGSPAFGANLAGQMLAQGDRNNDQKLSRDEVLALADTWFDQLDPDRVGRVGQEDFLGRLATILTATNAPAVIRGGRGGVGNIGAVGLFTAADANHDTSLTWGEFKQSFADWFARWDTDKSGALDRPKLVAGIASILPRTNLSGATGRETQDPIPGLPTPPPSPVLPPEDALKTIHVPDGFKVELVASEPMIEDPIAFTFDADGRLYVLEMRSFMLDIDRKGERDPIGRITRLEDTDGDGRFDKASVFVDHLIFPRAIAAANGGIFFVADNKLSFARDTDSDGRADRVEMVDADYGRGDVEHAPNGLMRAMDNWIYNGASTWRYRMVDGVLVKQRTEYRGQWGMSQDNFGRLIYNANDSQLMGDYTPPNYIGRNSHLLSTAGLNLFVSADQRVFPIRMTTAINRGYLREVLDDTGRAYVFASSCSPVIYRGDNFPAEFAGNAFVCDPAVNLIKRNIVFEQGLTLSSRFAYPDSEFLASTDERFRPVSAGNGPDGALWVVDMYRGIAQYGQFMTSYLRRETLSRGLDKGIHYGRIYRVVSTIKKPKPFPHLSQESAPTLVSRLSDPNGWIRDTAQRLLVENGDRSVATALVDLAGHGTNLFGRLHALWTLEGLHIALPPVLAQSAGPSTNLVRLMSADTNLAWHAPNLSTETLMACVRILSDPNPKIQSAALRVTESLAAAGSKWPGSLLQEIARRNSELSDEVAFQTALTVGNLPKPESLPVLARIAARSADQLLIRDAIVSGLENWELQFLQLLLSDPQWNRPQPGRSALLSSLANAVIKERQPTKIELLFTLAAGQSTNLLWRQRAILEGIAVNGGNRFIRPIALNSAPPAFDAFSKSADEQIRQLAVRSQTAFTWPGHSNESTANAKPAAPLSAGEASLIAQGRTLFEQVCAGCHGLTGQGLKPLAPPLANSDWVLGPESRLIRIALHGLTGPVKVGDTTYQPPDVLPDMPALGVLDDTQLASILSYIRHDWGHEATSITPARVAAIREETKERQVPWSESHLLQVR